MRGPILRKVDAVGLAVPDLDAGIRFYARLGHTLVWRTPNAAGLRMPDTDAELMLQVDRPDQEVDLLVEAVDDAAARVIEAGGSVMVEPFDITIGRCAVVADPWAIASCW
jgi:catechol 2,3-dioxygenase-like lactoylglutathione lyase family enzyme